MGHKIYMHWMISRSYDKTRTTFHHATCRQATFTIFIVETAVIIVTVHLHCRHRHHVRRRYLQAQTAFVETITTIFFLSSKLPFVETVTICVVATYGHKPPFTLTIFASSPLSSSSSLTGTNRPFRYHMYVGAGRLELE